jgi:hypothetical protein
VSGRFAFVAVEHDFLMRYARNVMLRNELKSTQDQPRRRSTAVATAMPGGDRATQDEELR